MSEKFKQYAAAPEKMVKKLRMEIGKTNPSEYVRDIRAAGLGLVSEKDSPRAAAAEDAMRTVTLNTAKWSAWLAAGGAQFLLWLGRVALLDNAVIRKMENRAANPVVKDDKNPTVLQQFGKKYPGTAAHLLYYVIAGVTFGAPVAAVKTTQAAKDVFDIHNTWVARQGTFGAYLDKMKPITPLMALDLMAKEGTNINPQTGLHEPYLDSKSIPTIGFGSTELKDGTKVTMNTPPITSDEAYELARWHLEQNETYFVMYCYDVGLGDSVNINTTSHAFGMGSIIYNAYSQLIEEPNDRNHRERMAELRNLYNEYGAAVTDDMVRECFAKYPVRDTRSFGAAWIDDGPAQAADKLGNFLAGGAGLRWRRWMEAGLLTGDITPEMLMDIPANGMYEFYKVMGSKKSAFFTGAGDSIRFNKKTVSNFKEWLKNPVNENGQELVGENWPKLKDLLPTNIAAECESGKCKLGNGRFLAYLRATWPTRHDVETKTYVMGYDDWYQAAIGAYRAGDYAAAASQFENMIAQHPKNALLRNDLAVTYNKMGRYADAVTQARAVVHDIGDKSQYAAAQYNAGFAYEQMGNLDRALANYKLALANGNRAAQNAITRVTNKKRAGMEKSFSSGGARVHNMAAAGQFGKINNKNSGRM